MIKWRRNLAASLIDIYIPPIQGHNKLLNAPKHQDIFQAAETKIPFNHTTQPIFEPHYMVMIIAAGWQTVERS